MPLRNNARKKDKPNITDFTAKNSAAILLLESWINDKDENEQKETFEYLKEVERS